MINLLLKLRMYWRLMFNVCPACNSDAPKKYDCKICNDFYGCPTQNIKNVWHNNYIKFLK